MCNLYLLQFWCFFSQYSMLLLFWKQSRIIIFVFYFIERFETHRRKCNLYYNERIIHKRLYFLKKHRRMLAQNCKHIRSWLDSFAKSAQKIKYDQILQVFDRKKISSFSFYMAGYIFLSFYIWKEFVSTRTSFQI